VALKDSPRSAHRPQSVATESGIVDGVPLSAKAATSPAVSLQCPPPVVTLVQAQPFGWELLSALLFGLLVRAWLQRLPKAPATDTRSQPKPPDAPHQVRTVRPEEHGKADDLASALRGLGYKKPEIQARLASADLTLPLDQLIRSALHAKGEPS
jgi:hypothetical protein